MKRLTFIIFFLVFTSSAHALTIYKWVDKEGVENFTEDYAKVPPIYRDHVEKLNIPEETPKIRPSTPSPAPVEKEQRVKTDIYGRDETWWREKVRPWKKQLKEATKHYENSHEELMKQVEIMGQWKFGSLTQYQMISNRVGILNQEMAQYQAQITEAREMLEKLSQEAEEAKADPDWLK